MESFDILNNKIRKKILKEFLTKKKELKYDYFKEFLKDDTSRPDYHLNLLVKNNFLYKIKGRGNYKLNEKLINPLRSYFGIKKPVCLIGGLGDISLYIDVLDALKQYSIIPNKYIIITSPERKKEWEECFNELNGNMKTLIINKEFKFLREKFEEICNILEEQIKNEIYNHEIICELTGGTKPVSIALMLLGEQYKLQRIYYSGNKIIWIEN
ncbi:MAG: hypothetical protein ACTSPW_19990 [Promethearchaeota archaeon]